MPLVKDTLRHGASTLKFELRKCGLTKRRSISAAGILTCITIAFCASPETVWSAKFESPDGNWIGNALTKQWAGPGTAAIETNVFLQRAHVSESPKQIVEFDNETVWPKGITNVELKWLTPSHLEVGYRGRPTITWQVVKFADLDISIRDLSRDSIKVSP